MIHNLPPVLEFLTVSAVILLVVVSVWPPEFNLAVRWPVLSASVMSFGFMLATALLSRMLDGMPLMLIVSALIFLSSVSIVLLMGRLGDNNTPEDKEQQS